MSNVDVKINSEINNNSGSCFAGKVLRKTSQVSLSSVSDCQSDSSEDGSKIEMKTSLQEIAKKVEDKRAVSGDLIIRKYLILFKFFQSYISNYFNIFQNNVCSISFLMKFIFL